MAPVLDGSAGRTYLPFTQCGRPHMAAWRESGSLYWVVNTLPNDVPDAVLPGLARSCRPVSCLHIFRGVRTAVACFSLFA